MNRMTVVLQNDMKDIVRSRQFLIIAIIVGLIVMGATTGITIALRMWLDPGVAWEEAQPLLELFVGLTVNFVPLLVLFICMATWAIDPVAKEKARGPIESLLSTPLTGRGVWLGKSLAIFVPAYVMALVSTLLVLLVMNLAAIFPATQHFVLTPPQVLTGFFLLPLLMLAVMALGILFSLITNPVVGQTILIFFGVVFMQVVAQLGARITWLLGSWDYALYNLAGAVLLGGIAFYLSRLLSKERIILSSKGKWA